jgi:MarR family transcriptional regulator, lower aerobic nicotinate degradation pathway regulator
MPKRGKSRENLTNGPLFASGSQAVDAWPLSERPGFLIRRLHQIHVALFVRHCEGFDVTPVQFSLLSALAVRGIADQTMLAGDVALDRTTATGALKRLEDRRLARRVVSLRDRRAKLWSMTKQGAELLGRMQEKVKAAHHATIAALDRQERTLLVDLLGRLVESHEKLAVPPDEAVQNKATLRRAAKEA